MSIPTGEGERTIVVREQIPATRAIVRTILIVATAALTLYTIILVRETLWWIAIATFVSVALSGPIAALSRYIRRGFAIAIVYVAVILAPFLIALLVLPPFITQFVDLVANLPEYAADFESFVRGNDSLRSLENEFQVTTKLQEEASKLPDRIPDAAGVLSDLGAGLVNFIFTGVTILIMSIFLTASGPGWVRWMMRQRPHGERERLERLAARIVSAVGNWAGGALVQAAIAGITTYFVLLILGVPFAAPLAVLTALFDLIPLVGATIGAVLIGLVTVFNDFPIDTVIWVIWAVVFQQVENNIIQPQIQKRAVAVHPFVTIVSVLLGSRLFGILGALLAIPVAASIQIFVQEWWRFRRENQALAIAAPSAGIVPATGESRGPEPDPLR